MAPFYGWGSTTSRLQPLRGSSLLLPFMPSRLKLPLGSYMGSPVFLTSEIDQMITRNFRELSG